MGNRIHRITRLTALFMTTASFALWYYGPSSAAPAALSGVAWSQNCVTGIRTVFGDGYQAQFHNGRMTSLHKARFSRTYAGWSVDMEGTIRDLVVSDEGLLQTGNSELGIDITYKSPTLGKQIERRCPGPVDQIPRNSLFTEKSENRAEQGTITAMIAWDAVATRSFIELKPNLFFDGFSDIPLAMYAVGSTPEIVAIVLKAVRGYPDSTPRKAEVIATLKNAIGGNGQQAAKKSAGQNVSAKLTEDEPPQEHPGYSLPSDYGSEFSSFEDQNQARITHENAVHPPEIITETPVRHRIPDIAARALTEDERLPGIVACSSPGRFCAANRDGAISLNERLEGETLLFCTFTGDPTNPTPSARRQFRDYVATQLRDERAMEEFYNRNGCTQGTGEIVVSGLIETYWSEENGIEFFLVRIRNQRGSEKLAFTSVQI